VHVYVDWKGCPWNYILHVERDVKHQLSHHVRLSFCLCVGCLMLIAWMMCASTALLLAKYYKRMWPNDTLCGVEVWFAVSVVHSESDRLNVFNTTRYVYYAVVPNLWLLELKIGTLDTFVPLIIHLNFGLCSFFFCFWARRPCRIDRQMAGRMPDRQ